MRNEAWAGALWCNIQFCFSHNWSLFRRTTSLKRAKTSWYICLFIIWLRGTNKCWTMSFPSKTQRKSPRSLTDWWVLSWVEETLPHPLQRLHLGFNIIHINPRLISNYDVLKNILLQFALASNSWLISTMLSVWLLVNKHGTNFALTQPSWYFSVKISWKDPILMPTSSASFRTVKRWFPGITARTLSTWSSFIYVVSCSGMGYSPTDILLSLKALKPLITLRSAHTVLPVCLLKQLKCLCKMFTKFAAKFHTHSHARVVLRPLSLTLFH